LIPDKVFLHNRKTCRTAPRRFNSVLLHSVSPNPKRSQRSGLQLEAVGSVSRRKAHCSFHGARLRFTVKQTHATKKTPCHRIAHQSNMRPAAWFLTAAPIELCSLRHSKRSSAFIRTRQTLKRHHSRANATLRLRRAIYLWKTRRERVSRLTRRGRVSRLTDSFPR
jgi:hypothetical protein